jgi:hypothetical protein
MKLFLESYDVVLASVSKKEEVVAKGDAAAMAIYLGS